MAADDAELVALAKKGVERAWVDLYERYKSPLFTYCVGLLGSVEDAEDALQETFRYFFGRLEAYVHQGKLKPYLYRLAHSFCFDILRRRQRAPRPLETDIEIPGTSPELIELVRACMSRLAPVARGAITLRLLHDFSYEEISETLDCPLGTVKSRIHNAIEQLRQCVGAVAKDFEI